MSQYLRGEAGPHVGHMSSPEPLREVSIGQVQDFLLREFEVFLWLAEALVEDEELQNLVNSGTPTLVRSSVPSSHSFFFFL